MEPHARDLPRAAGSRQAVGSFRPALPADTFEVMQLFAVAARAVCAAPQALDDASLRLQSISGQLVAPEAAAAHECLRLWRLFARVAQVPKDALRIEAGRAFCRDLDALGQRLDMPPLPDWDDLPQGVEAASPVDPGSVPAAAASLSLAEVSQRLAALLADVAGASPAQRAEQVAALLARIAGEPRRLFFDAAVGQGILGRSEVSLLVRFLVKGGPVAAGDTTLVGVLLRLGRQLAEKRAGPPAPGK